MIDIPAPIAFAIYSMSSAISLLLVCIGISYAKSYNRYDTKDLEDDTND